MNKRIKTNKVEIFYTLGESENTFSYVDICINKELVWTFDDDKTIEEIQREVDYLLKDSGTASDVYEEFGIKIDQSLPASINWLERYNESTRDEMLDYIYNLVSMYVDEFGSEDAFYSKYGSEREFLINEVGMNDEDLTEYEGIQNYCHVCGDEAETELEDGTFVCGNHDEIEEHEFKEGGE